MLPDLTFLLAVLLGLGTFAPGDYDPLLAFGGTAALTAIAVALVSMAAERSIRGLHEEGGLASAQARLALLPLTPLLAWLVSLETLHFGSAIYDLLPSTTWLLRHVLLFVPALIGFGAAWTARAKVEAAVAQRLGRPVVHATAAQAIRAGLKRNGLALIPLGVVLGLLEGLSLAADLGVPACATVRAALEDLPQLRVAFELALLGLLALVLPALLARLISSEPFPAGPQRERLEQLASALRLRYREMRLWKTGGRGLNAMVVGLTPGTRRIFVTDGLLQALPPHEVEAVFCHEAGHAKRHHLLWFLGVAGLLSLAFLVLDEPLTRLGLGEGLMRSLLHLALLWFVVLGSLSRQFERESDVDGGAHAALLDPAAPPLEVPGLTEPLPAGAVRMVGALKRIEALMGDVYSHRHGRPSERAAYVAYHATQPAARAGFARRSRGLRLGILALGALLVAQAMLRLPDDLGLAEASGALRSARAAHGRAFEAVAQRPAEAPAIWAASHADYRRAAEGLAESPRLHAQGVLPLAWLGMGDTALRGTGELAAARTGLERAIAAAQAANQPGPWRRVIFEARVDLGLVALREGQGLEEATQLLAQAERQPWSNEGAAGRHARARLRLLAGALDLAGPQPERGARMLRDLLALPGQDDETVEVRRDALQELTRHGLAPSPAPPPSASRTAHPASLEELMRSVVAAQNAGERERFLALMRSLVPTRAELRQVLRQGPATDAFLAAAKEMTVEDGALAKDPPADKQLPKTERTEVVVHAATTEELVAYVKGTTAFQEFPGGMRRFAERVAAPGRTWYTLEMVEPGKELGTRITCFTRLGERFLLIAKPWRALPREEEPPAEDDVEEPR